MQNLDGPRGCKLNEFGETLDLLNFVFRSNVGQRPSMGGNYPHMYRESNVDNLRIIRINRCVISHVGIYPTELAVGKSQLKVGGIGGVATDPDFRQRGYAGMLLEDCIHKMESEGYDVSILWTGIHDYYRKFGWENAGRQRIYFLDRGNFHLLPKLKYDVYEGADEPSYIEQVRAIHEKDRLGVIRDYELTKIMLAIPKLTVYLALDGDRVKSYAVIMRTYLNEYGGELEAVTGLVRYVFEKEGMVSFRIATPDYEEGLPKFLDNLGFPKEIDYIGMLRIINMRSILDKLGLPDVKVEEEKDMITLTWKEQRTVLTRREASKLLFGPEKVSNFAEGILPVNLYWWGTDHM